MSHATMPAGTDSVLAGLRPYGITRFLTIDTEFRLDQDFRQHVVCLVAHEWPSGCIQRIWLDDQPQQFQLPHDEQTLWICYVAGAELRSMLAVGHSLPKRVLDLYVENRWINNLQEATWARKSKQKEGFFRLTTTLRRFGCNSISAEEKEELRERILLGGPYADKQKQEILDYCESDVNALDALLPKMMPRIDFARAVARGSYLIEVAKIEDFGIPVDKEKLDQLRLRRHDLIRHIISQHPHLNVYEDLTFSQAKFEAFLIDSNLADRWRKTPTGLYTSEDSYLKEMGQHVPVIEELRQLKKLVLQLQHDRFQAGADGRARCPLWPFSSITGRNQPSAGQLHRNGRSESPFIFGLPKALRFLIQPKPGSALAYIDWEQQEFIIAALMSGDKEMATAYETGNPYLALGKRLGEVPETATKETHRREHEKYKAVVLGVNYGRTKHGLSKALGLPTHECDVLLKGYRQAFFKYAEWQKIVRVLMFGYGRLWVWDGWQCLLGQSPNPRSVLNWPIQSTGAVLLRLAVILAARKGVRIIATVHDAVLIEAPEHTITLHVERMKEAMDEACRVVLGQPLRTESQIILSSGRYRDEKGEHLWKTICEFMGWDG